MHDGWAGLFEGTWFGQSFTLLPALVRGGAGTLTRTRAPIAHLQMEGAAPRGRPFPIPASSYGQGSMKIVQV